MLWAGSIDRITFNCRWLSLLESRLKEGKPTIMSDWFHRLDAATLGVTVKVGKREVTTKHLNHPGDIRAKLFLVGMELSWSNVDIEGNFVECECLSRMSARTTN